MVAQVGKLAIGSVKSRVQTKADVSKPSILMASSWPEPPFRRREGSRAHTGSSARDAKARTTLDQPVRIMLHGTGRVNFRSGGALANTSEGRREGTQASASRNCSSRPCSGNERRHHAPRFSQRLAAGFRRSAAESVLSRGFAGRENRSFKFGFECGAESA